MTGRVSLALVAGAAVTSLSLAQQSLGTRQVVRLRALSRHRPLGLLQIHYWPIAPHISEGARSAAARCTTVLLHFVVFAIAHESVLSCVGSRVVLRREVAPIELHALRAEAPHHRSWLRRGPASAAFASAASASPLHVRDGRVTRGVQVLARGLVHALHGESVLARGRVHLLHLSPDLGAHREHLLKVRRLDTLPVRDSGDVEEALLGMTRDGAEGAKGL
mmetsp:Transcript_1589/g.4481  ORF Transcript_1589/g.4481 Transcript_1589/m.4481 type:complete len:220 (+) Transcript_1589:963-1622(+)